MSTPSRTAPSADDLLTLHALTWLVVVCAVGLTMALLLVVPEAGAVLGPFTYGRLAPVHLDAALYGWCALPLVGLLLRWYRGSDGSAWPAAAAIQVWSGCLLAGVAAWLLGESSGKVFLEFSGAARWLFVAGQFFLAAVLAGGLWRERQRLGRVPRAKAALLALLLLVPLALVAATSRATYPPVNPDSGGPTGADLLGSTLGALFVLVAAPPALGLQRESDARATRNMLLLLGAHGLLFVTIGGRDASHREPLEVAALASLGVWAWLLPRHLSRFAWPPAARAWRVAVYAWGAALLATGIGAFLPGVLERVKFTNVLVGHAHIAMAGFATSFGGLVLVTLGGGAARVLAAPKPFLAFHAWLALHVAAVTAVGTLEAFDPGVLFRPALDVTALYALRAAAGIAMLGAAVLWLRRVAQEAA